MAADLPEGAWTGASAGAGSKGERLYDWARAPLLGTEPPGSGRWLLVRRSIADPVALVYYLAHGPEGTPLGELAGWRTCAGPWSAPSRGFPRTGG